MGDIMTPVARAIGGKEVYDKINVLKGRIQLVIEDHLGLPARKRLGAWVATAEVKQMDLAALLIEKKMFAFPETIDWNLPQPPYEFMQEMYRVMTSYRHWGTAEYRADTITRFRLRLNQWSR